MLYGPKAGGSWPATGTSLIGQQGPQGSAGQQGPQGTGATVTQLASGDANCADGGASITDGNGNTAYACTGATGAAGTSTAGPAGLDVVIVTAYGTTNAYGNAVAGVYCPADHPNLIGGSASQAEIGPGDTIEDDEITGPVTQFPFGGAWYGSIWGTAALVPPANGLLSYAFCAK